MDTRGWTVILDSAKPNDRVETELLARSEILRKGQIRLGLPIILGCVRACEKTGMGASIFLYYCKYGIYGLCGYNMDPSQRRIAREVPSWPLFHIQKPRP